MRVRTCTGKGYIRRRDIFAEPLSKKTLLQLLRTEKKKKEWQVIAIDLKDSLQGNTDFESIIRVCLESQLISRDLTILREMLMALNRLDVATRIREYQSLFIEMSALLLTLKKANEKSIDIARCKKN